MLLALARPGASICYIYIYTYYEYILALASPGASICYIYIHTHVYVCIVSILPVTCAADVGQPQYLEGH